MVCFSTSHAVLVIAFGSVKIARMPRSGDNDDKYVNNKFASVQHSFQLLLRPAANGKRGGDGGGGNYYN